MNVCEDALNRMYIDIEAGGKAQDADYIMDQLQRMTTKEGVPMMEAALKSRIQKVKTMVNDSNNKLETTYIQCESYQKTYQEIAEKLDELENEIKSTETYETDLPVLEAKLKDAITKALMNDTLNKIQFYDFCQEIKVTNDKLRQDTLSICNMYSNKLWIIELKRKVYKCFDDPDSATLESISKDYSALLRKHFKCELNLDSTNLKDITLACHRLAKYYAVLPEWNQAAIDQVDQPTKITQVVSKENGIAALQAEQPSYSTTPIEPNSQPKKSFSSGNTTIGSKSVAPQPLPRRQSSLKAERPVSLLIPNGRNSSVISFASFDDQSPPPAYNNQRYNALPVSPISSNDQQQHRRLPTLEELRSRAKAEFRLGSKKQLEKFWKRHLDTKKIACNCLMCGYLSQPDLYNYCKAQCPRLCDMQDMHESAVANKEKCICSNCKCEESYLSGLLAIHKGLVTINFTKRQQQMMYHNSKLPAHPPPSSLPSSSSQQQQQQQQQLAYRPLPPPPPQHFQHQGAGNNHPFQHNRMQVESPNKKSGSIENPDKQKGFLNKLKGNLFHGNDSAK
jgi:hypothetical protein